MPALLLRLTPIFHLTRITMGFAAVANVWFVILWTRVVPVERDMSPPAHVHASHWPLWIVLAGGAAYALGLFAFATALNDTLDVRRDRALNPSRPIPSGRLSVETAAWLIALTLLTAMLGSVLLGLGAVLMALLTAATVLFYNAVARYVPSFGLVALGLIYGAHMMTPNPYLSFVWPVLLVMAHSLLVGAVTHRLARKRPALTWRVLLVACAGGLFWSGVLLYVGFMRSGAWWPDWVPLYAAVAPLLLALGFVAYAWHKARLTPDRVRAADKVRRYGAVWVSLYAVAWMLGAGHLRSGAILGALTLVGLIGITLLREVYGLIEHPVGYRR
ncbi:MAG TPA: hypothetical protein DEB06_00195 [Phycisphaerales bacterium]|nr:hypothetical protein [Phycisphaerales bacterium]